MDYLGTSKVSTDNKVTIIKDVQLKLNLKKGDLVAFYQDNDNIVIKAIKL